jgi:hypothetical protein
LECIGQLVRIEQGRRIKVRVNRRRRGRPGLRWLEDVEKNLRETKKVDRDQWASVIKEAKAIRGT